MSLNFAPYSSPPSSPRASTSRLPTSTSSSKATRPKSPWFGVGSYQSGARPSDLANPNAISSASSQTHQYPSGDVLWDAENGNAAGPSGTSGSGGAVGLGADSYETTFGWRVDFEAAAAYAAGPFLAIVLLALETKNDYV